MSTSDERRPPESPASASTHLSVRPDGDGPVQVRFLFEQPDGKRIGGVLGAGALTHVVVILLVVLIASLIPERTRQAFIPPQLSERLVFLSDPGPGGGGGGGNKMPDPPKPVEIVKPKPKPVVEALPTPVKEPPPVEPQTLPVQTLEATVTTPGTVESTQASNSISLGSGTGTGAGSGQGSGADDGFGGGFGGGAFRPGNGVVLPRLVRDVKPQYTADAMRAKVQGTVLLECVVMPDGSVGKVQVIRSLDSTFGLDQEAIKAARQWRFTPGTRFGEPVAVLVTIELTFTLR
jgi:protein TonB